MTNLDLTFLDTTDVLSYSHFIFIKELDDLDETKFWTTEKFKNLMEFHLKNMKFKQGGGILISFYDKVTFEDNDRETDFLVFGVIFEKRVNLGNPEIFSFSHYDIESSKAYNFSNYRFLKMRKNKFFLFFKLLKSENFKKWAVFI